MTGVNDFTGVRFEAVGPAPVDSPSLAPEGWTKCPDWTGGRCDGCGAGGGVYWPPDDGGEPCDLPEAVLCVACMKSEVDRRNQDHG